jgi:hypothetical protein
MAKPKPTIFSSSKVWEVWVFEKAQFAMQRGNLTENEAFSAFLDRKEGVAARTKMVKWLRKELAILRDEQRKPGTAPVRRGQTLSRADIADMASALLSLFMPRKRDDLTPLIELIEELLDVNRHREAFASRPYNTEAFWKAAKIERDLARAGRKVGVREIARQVGVSVGTVTAWRRRFEWYRFFFTGKSGRADGKFSFSPEMFSMPLEAYDDGSPTQLD